MVGTKNVQQVLPQITGARLKEGWSRRSIVVEYWSTENGEVGVGVEPA